MGDPVHPLRLDAERAVSADRSASAVEDALL
jgi:hypothetical protein